MKNLIKYFPVFGLISLVILSSCNTEDQAPSVGEGEGKLGVALVLKNNSINMSNARVENNNLTIEEGFIQIKELDLEVEGRNESGKFEKEIEIEFNDIKKINFNQFDKSVDFFINIPEGEYKEIELELDLIDYKNQPSIYFEGNFTDDEGNTIPFQFEYYGDDIDFEVEIEADDDDNYDDDDDNYDDDDDNYKYFTVDRINNPLALFELNAVNWLRNVTSSEMANADRTDGKILLTRNSNSDIYKKIKSNIEASSEIEVNLD
ncbi:hypothetical protein [Shivajiella indica]|uniref:DUF4382 domain-containing protein n=1 Tax=Shivajiella indica TaxID=872115 RepID=A0ABW5B9G6_9BACT